MRGQLAEQLQRRARSTHRSELARIPRPFIAELLGWIIPVEAKDVAAQDQGFINTQYYWQWMANHKVTRKLP